MYQRLLVINYSLDLEQVFGCSSNGVISHTLKTKLPEDISCNLFKTT